MARVQLVIPDQDRDRYVSQAKHEGLSLSAWLRAAAEERLHREAEITAIRSTAALQTFFAACDALAGDGEEPDWEQHRRVIDASRRRGTTES
jgi:hypothetical protein